MNEILLNLFILNSSRAYEKEDVKSAYSALKECENIFGIHPQTFEHYVSLARFSYDLGKIDEAKDYTNKMKLINKNWTEVYLNEGFFGILNDDEETIYENYKELSKNYKHKKSTVTFKEVISWQKKEKQKYPNRKILFEFVIGTLNLFYSDKLLGLKILNNINTEELKNSYPKIYELTNTFLKRKIYSKDNSFTKKRKPKRKRIFKKRKKR